MNYHESFVKLFFYQGSPTEHKLIMEYIDCPDLFELVQSKGEFSYKKAKTVVHQLSCAINELHAQGFIHNDIKLENILYFEVLDRVHICDYGLCKRENTTSVRDGTLDYFSPEKIRHHKYARSFDWYAVGVLTYKLLTGGKHPFEKYPDEQLSLNSMKRRQQFVDMESLNSVHDIKGRNFVYDLIRYEYGQRLTTFKKIINHPFFY
jgi:serine/threonine protein kinase